MQLSRVVLFALALSGFAAVVQAQAPADRVPDHYVIEVNAGAAPAAVAAAHGLAPKFVYSSALKGFSAMVPPGRLAALARDPSVTRIAPDYVVTAHAKPGGGTPPPAGQVLPEGVKRIGAVNPGYTGAGIGVAIVDTGLDLNHADLQPAVDGFSAFGASAQDDNGHGTHVGGIVAARNNTVGVVGVAPEATLYAVKVLNAQGSGYDSEIIAGLDWIAKNAHTVTPAIRVVNMSLGRSASGDDVLMHTAVENLAKSNIVVVVSAGNTCSAEISGMAPAGFPEVLPVASTTAKDGTSATSRISPIRKDSPSYFTTDGIGCVSAPGEDQENVSKGGQLSGVGILSTKLGGGTTRMSGTSMAAPHVAGVAALMWQKAATIGATSLTSANVQAQIRSSSELIGSAPIAGRTGCYSFDGVAEGIVSTPNALGTVVSP